jgi:hypothetical protein
MKFIGIVFVLCLMFGAVKAQQNTVTPTSAAPKPPPLKLGKNDTIQTYVTLDSGKLIPWIVKNI